MNKKSYQQVLRVLGLLLALLHRLGRQLGHLFGVDLVKGLSRLVEHVHHGGRVGNDKVSAGSEWWCEGRRDIVSSVNMEDWRLDSLMN